MAAPKLQRIRISQREWYAGGGLSNRRLSRTKARNGRWYYWLNY